MEWEKFMRNRNKIRLVRWLALVIAAVCLVKTGQLCFHSAQQRAQQEELKEMTTKADVKAPAPDSETRQEKIMSILAGQTLPDIAFGDEQEEQKPAILEKYAALYEKNKDLVGWLSIEDMKIDYPVMQNEDDEFYLHHDFYGEDSKYGCLYVRKKADLEAGTNFIIYGHNMKDGSMFGDLDLYLEEDFYREHPVISFNTLDEERSYEIVAAFCSQVYDEEDDVFKYYRFYEADTREEFDNFYDNIKALSLYDTGVEAAFGDTFLTLSTCAYHVTDGRFVVVAKRVE